MSKIGESKLIDHEIPSWIRIGQAAAMTAPTATGVRVIEIRAWSSLQRWGQKLFFRLNVHQDFCDPWHTLQYSVFHIVCNVVPLTYRQSSFNDDMQVNVISKAHLADVAFLKADDSRHS